MVTFIRGGEFFLSRGQIYVKLLPNGESVRLTNDADAQVRTGVHTGRLADRVYRVHIAPLPALGYLDRSGARRPADAAPAQRVRTHLDRRSPGAVFRDHDRDPPHGDRDRDGRPGGVAGDLFPAARERDGALLLRVTGPSSRFLSSRWTSPTRLINRAGCCRLMEAPRAGRSDLRAPARQPPGLRTEQWMYFGASVGGSSHLWRQKFPDGAPEQITFGPIEEEGIALAPDGRSLVTSVGNASERDLDSRRGRRAGDLVGRLRRGSPPFPGWHARVLSLRAGPGGSGDRLGGIVSRIALDGPRLREDRQCAARRVRHGLRYFARREGSGLHDNGQQWRIADLAGVPRPAHTTSPDRSSRRSGVLRR